MPDVGKFRVGSQLGEERAGFSGRAMVQVFAQAGTVEWTAISECLASPEVEAEMYFFTGVLVDEALEPNVERLHREVDNLRVVVRGLNGAYLGGLPAGFTCTDLVELLRWVRARSVMRPRPSPIYLSLLESSASITDLIQRGEGERAVKYAEFLKELEGASSPAVQAAEAALGR
jgi:hypothetical protein